MTQRMIKPTLTALTVILLSQPMFATTTNDLNDCFNIENQKSVTIDAKKFTDVWLELHVNKNANNNTQQHLQAYIENSLDATKGQIDVLKFSNIWSKAGNRTQADHLTKKLDEMIEHASKGMKCSSK